jgi:hypothetical protein
MVAVLRRWSGLCWRWGAVFDYAVPPPCPRLSSWGGRYEDGGLGVRGGASPGLCSRPSTFGVAVVLATGARSAAVAGGGYGYGGWMVDVHGGGRLAFSRWSGGVREQLCGCLRGRRVDPGEASSRGLAATTRCLAGSRHLDRRPCYGFFGRMPGDGDTCGCRSLVEGVFFP